MYKFGVKRACTDRKQTGPPDDLTEDRTAGFILADHLSTSGIGGTSPAGASPSPRYSTPPHRSVIVARSLASPKSASPCCLLVEPALRTGVRRAVLQHCAAGFLHNCSMSGPSRLHARRRSGLPPDLPDPRSSLWSGVCI